MELRRILHLYRQNLLKILICGILGLVIGVGLYYLLPPTFESSGSFFISRKIENSSNTYFTYEGYYSQQTAVNFTNTFVSIAESIDVKKSALQQLAKQVNEYEIRELGRNMRVKKAGPQLVTIYAKAGNSNEAEHVWKALSKAALDKSTQLTAEDDPSIRVLQVSTLPVVKETFRNVFLNGLLGFLLGAFVYKVYLAIKLCIN